MEIDCADLVELIIDDTQTGIDYCQLILSTTSNFSNFQEFYDHHLKNARISTCQNSWTLNTISVHCNDCGANPNSCVCLQCFLNGNHQGHNYSISIFSAGNCDCGDRSYWKPSGFCKHHHGLEENSHPEDYLDKKLQTLLTDIIFKASFMAIQKIKIDDVVTLSEILQFLKKFLKFGDGFRRLLSISLTEKINFEKFMNSIFDFSPEFNDLLVEFFGSFVNDEVFRNNFAKINFKLMIDKVIPFIYSSIRENNITVSQNILPWRAFWSRSFSESLFAKHLATGESNWIEYIIKILDYAKELLTFKGLNYKHKYMPSFFNHLSDFVKFAMKQTDEEKQILFDKFVDEILSKKIDDAIVTTTFDSYTENDRLEYIYSFDSFFYDFIQTFKSSEKVKFDKMFEIIDKLLDISTIFMIGKNSVGNGSVNDNDRFIYHYIKSSTNVNHSIKDDYYKSFPKGSSFFICNPLIQSLAYFLRNDESCRLKIAEFLSLEKYQSSRIQIGIAALKSILALVCLSQSLVPKTNIPPDSLFSLYANNPYFASKGISLFFPLLQLVIGIQCNENDRSNEFSFKEFFAYEMAREIGIFDDFKDDFNKGNKKQMVFTFLYLSLLLVTDRLLFNFDPFKFNKEQIIIELKQGVSDLNELGQLFDNKINSEISSSEQFNRIIDEVASVRQRNSTKNFENYENDVSFVLKEGIEVNYISAINSFNKEQNLMDDEIKKHPNQLINIQPFEPEESYFFNHSEKVNVSLKEFLITPTVFSIVYKTLRKSSESHSNELNDHLAMNILLLISKFVKDPNFQSVNSVKSTLKPDKIIKYKSTIIDLIIQLERSVFNYIIHRNGSSSIQNTITKEAFDLLLKTKIKSLNETPKSIVDILIEKGELGKNVLRQMGIEIDSDTGDKQDYINQMKKVRAKQLKENILVHFKSVSSSFNLNESNEDNDEDDESNSQKDICSICSLASKDDVLSYPLYIYRTKFPFIFDKPPLVEMTKLNSLKEADILQDIDILQPPNIKEDDYEDEKDIVPDTDTIMSQFLSNSPILDITNDMNGILSDFARNSIDYIHQLILIQHEKMVQEQNERKNQRKQAKINQFQREKNEFIQKQNSLINPNSIVSKRCTAGNLFVIQFGICQHLVHPNCVQQDDFICPIDRSFKNGFLPNIDDLTDDVIYANANDKTFEKFSEKFKEALNIFINKYSFFFRASENKIIDLFVELVKSLSGLIVTYEVRLRSLPDCLDSKKTKILARNLFLTTWYAYRMRGKPTMKTGFNDDVSEKVDLKLTVFQRFIKKLIETDEIEKDVSTKNEIIKQIVSSFVQSSFKEEKEKCLFLRRVCLADHFLLKNKRKEENESRIEIKNHEFIDWDEILTLQNLSEKYNIPFKDLSEEFVFKPFIFSKMPKEFLRFALEPYNFPVDQVVQLTVFNILDYNNLIANYDDMNENEEVDIDYLNELNIIYEKEFDLSIHKLFSDKNYPSVLLFIGKNASSICVVDGKRMCYMRPFYSDRFGCTDIGYKSQQPLFLNDERYERFMDQILSGEFTSKMEKF